MYSSEDISQAENQNINQIEKMTSKTPYGKSSLNAIQY